MDNPRSKGFENQDFQTPVIREAGTRVVREAGWNRAQKLLRKGVPLKLWLASDADMAFASQVIAVAQSFGVKPDRSKTGRQLSAMTGVEVFTAVLCTYTVSD